MDPSDGVTAAWSSSSTEGESTLGQQQEGIIDLGAGSNEGPVITLESDTTLYVWPASTIRTFLEPTVTAFDPIDSVNMKINTTYYLCRLPSEGLPGVLMGEEPGEIDLPSSGLQCSSTVPSLNSSQPNKAQEAYLVEHRVTNSRNISATPKRLLVVISDPCQSQGESWCFDRDRCSLAGQCVEGDDVGLGSVTSTLTGSSRSTSSGGTSSRPVLPVVQDTVPPRLILAGTGQIAMNRQGHAIMFHDVPYGSEWIHPGVFAEDANEYGITVNISDRIQSYGVAAVDTTVATPPTALYGFRIQYTVTDEAGNYATPAWRLIRIVCSAPESFCLASDAASGTSIGRCTFNGICLSDTITFRNTEASSRSRSSSSNSVSGSAVNAIVARSSSAVSSLHDGYEPAKDLTSPRIALQGPRFVELVQNSNFDRCAYTSPFKSLCDKGAAAKDPRDGILDYRVTICGRPLNPGHGLTRVPVLVACGVSTRKPGYFNLTYTVRNSAGASASTWRQITVRPVCPAGERLCDDRVACSQDGVCISELSPESFTASTAETSVRQRALPRFNRPPVISLITKGYQAERVAVKQGSRYAYCNGAESLPDNLCEAGALAGDPDGGPGGEPIDLTAHIIACPPSACLSTASGCSAQVLNSYRLTRRGLAGCGIDTMAPVGSVFSVDFWVWDADYANASVIRYVEITDPCPRPNGGSQRYRLCKDLHNT
ncbi:hypothetical protein Vretimale_14689 [Volvox reticuliferus]|uniref:Pesticidal crystal protein Cry22Aa Ig-like domain-containing protein n=1 Tax=Volvox reticuliferus TaxID=1737510 RepID=A0A8J4LVJ8_9CHLO|nr:hypothetical protein Vretimale_14689 [Volvox reticuliferus]